MFQFLYVLHAAPSVVKEPVLVGTDQEYYYWHDGSTKYNGMRLIARWGEALEDWGTLFKRAQEVFLQKTMGSLAFAKVQLEMAEKMIAAGVAPTNKDFTIEKFMQAMPYVSA